MTNARRLAVVILVALLLAAGVGWSLVHRTASSETKAPNAPQTPVATVTEGNVPQVIHLAGRAGPSAGTQTKLAFPLTGTVAHVYVHLGDAVSAGMPLADIDATSYELAARQAGADARAAAATASAASVDRLSVKMRVDEAELARQQRLYGAGVVALREVQAAQATVAADRAERQGSSQQRVAAQAQSQSANARAASAGYDVTRTVLRAPADGTVTGIFVQPGELADPVTAVIALTPAAANVATLDVPVADVAQLSPGNPVQVRAAGRTFRAVVAGVAPSVNPATGLAAVDVRGVPAGIAAGTPLDAVVTVGYLRGLIVPRSAIVDDPQSGDTLVFVRRRKPDGSMHFEARNVTVDGQGDGLVRISSGLSAGERVAAQGAIDLLVPADTGA